MKFKIPYLVLAVVILSHFQCRNEKPLNGNGKEMDSTEKKSSGYWLEISWASDTAFRTPESVIYDPVRDVLYVACINKEPWIKDGDGFIARLSPTGELVELEWIKELSGPKGMAIIDNILFIADIDELVLVDINSGHILEKIPVEGAVGLNDVTQGPDGSVLISDSNGDKIFQYKEGIVGSFIEEATGGPNGLYMVENKLFVAFAGSSEFGYYDLNTKEKIIICGEIGGGDGVTPTNEPEKFLVSDWNGEVFLINTEGNSQSLLRTKDQQINAADIWFIKEKNLLLVPTFFDNRIMAYQLKKEQSN